MTQQFCDLVSLLTDIKFNRNEGTHKTFFKVILELNDTSPIDVIGAEEPVGKLTEGMDGNFVLERNVESAVI
jgi:hypothetical protein